MTKFAVLILAHRDPECINRFIRQIVTSPGEHGVFVHIDARAEGVAKAILQHPRVHVLEDRIAVRWADITQVEATLKLLRAALEDDADYSLLTVRSGQDLVIRPDWAEYFSEPSRSWTSWKRVDDHHSFAAWTRCRWPRFTRQAYRSKAHPLRVLRGGILALAKRGIRLFPNRKTLPEGWTVYHGTQWVTLARAHAEFVMRELEARPEILEFFAVALSPEERLFQTVLMNGPHAEEVVREKSHVEEFVGNHPRTLGMEDREMLESSGKPFARKFDPAVDSRIIEYFCAQMEQRGPAADTLNPSTPGTP